MRKRDKHNGTCPQQIRGVVDADQKIIPTKSYQETNYPDTQEKKEIGKQLGLETKQISTWFKNMRKRDEHNGTSPRQIRSVVDAHQKIILTKSYQETKYPNTQQTKELGKQLGLDTKQISIWFKSMRKSDKLNGTCPRQFRRVVNADQKIILTKSYLETKYPDTQQTKELGKQLGLETRQISIWFKNMRRRDKLNGTCHERPIKPTKSYHSQFKRTEKYQNKATVKDSESHKNLKREEIGIDKTFFSKQTNTE